MKIHRIYNELNEITDISKDKVIITMSSSMYEQLRTQFRRLKYGMNDLLDKRFIIAFYDMMKEAEEQQTTEWTK